MRARLLVLVALTIGAVFVAPASASAGVTVVSGYRLGGAIIRFMPVSRAFGPGP
jgi:hypothetical protein